jgi:hypothetical protein
VEGPGGGGRNLIRGSESHAREENAGCADQAEGQEREGGLGRAETRRDERDEALSVCAMRVGMGVCGAGTVVG